MCNPGLDIILPFLFLIGGIIWTIICFIKIYKNKRNQFFKGSLIINLIVLVVSFSFIFYVLFHKR